MKFTSILLRVAVPFILIYVLAKVNIWLGVAGIAGYFVYVMVKGITSIYAYMGNMKYQQGKIEEAFTWFDKTVSRRDVMPVYLIGYGYLSLKHGNLDRAEELLERARGMKLDRELSMSLESNTALLLWKKGRLSDAVEKMESLYQEYKNTHIYGSLGYFYILTGDLDKALAFNQEAYEFNGSGSVIIDNLGQTHLLRGEYEAALPLYEKLSGLSPTFPEAYYNHGLVLEALGRKEEALERMQKSLQYPLSLLSTVTKEEIEGRIAGLKQV